MARPWFGAAPPLRLENARIWDEQNGAQTSTLRLARGRIDAIGASAHPRDARFDLKGAWVLPGLINAHDHLELDTFPRLKYRACYANAREWAAEVNARLETDPAIVAARAVPLADRLLIGGVSNLLAGATTVAHHNPLHPPLRRDFPVRVISRYGWSHSLYLAPDFQRSYRQTPRGAPWMIHLAEGTDAEARAELARLDDAGCLQDNTVLIHGVGLTAADRARVLERGAALIWCPSSNWFLLGATACVEPLAQAHRLAVGRDSRLTGERDLLDELRVAAELHQISKPTLLSAVTRDAARILRLDDAGEIAVGKRADLIILPPAWDTPPDALGQIRRADLRAVIVGGVVSIADPDFGALIPNGVPCALDGQPKLLARALAGKLQSCAASEPGLTFPTT